METQSDAGYGRSNQPIAISPSGDAQPIGLLPPTFAAEYVVEPRSKGLWMSEQTSRQHGEINRARCVRGTRPANLNRPN